MSKEKTLVVIVGPTAVGKTATAIFLAQQFNTSILSADSRQFYREMNIGTAKPSSAELQAAPHHFIDTHSIAADYSAGDYEREALVLLEKLFVNQDVVVMVGGSGLFIRAVCEGLDNLPKAPQALRDKLNAEFAQGGLLPLQERLKAVDPDYYAVVDRDNPQRIIRALEVFEASGKPLTYYQHNQRSNRPFQILTLGLNRERPLLYERINQRVDSMMEEGLLQEVEALLPYRDKPALQTVGYSEIFDYIDGNISLDLAVDKIKQNSRRYAKRQLTWFKKYGDTVWFQPDQQQDMLDYIRSHS